MNAIYVSGYLKSTPTIQTKENGYFLSFDMVNFDKTVDITGVVNELANDWSVSFHYEEDPSLIAQNLEQGIKVLVKGAATMNYQEADGEYILENALQGERLDVLSRDSSALTDSQYAWMTNPMGNQIFAS